MLKVVLHIDAHTFPQGIKELIAMDLEKRWNGRVVVVSVNKIEYEQLCVEGLLQKDTPN